MKAAFDLKAKPAQNPALGERAMSEVQQGARSLRGAREMVLFILNLTGNGRVCAGQPAVVLKAVQRYQRCCGCWE